LFQDKLSAKALNQAIGHDQDDALITRNVWPDTFCGYGTAGRMAMYWFLAGFFALFAVLAWWAFASTDLFAAFASSAATVPQRCLALARLAAIAAPLVAFLASLAALLQLWALRRRWPDVEQPLPFKTPAFYGRAKKNRQDSAQLD
jgi:hypothetical protein